MDCLHRYIANGYCEWERKKNTIKQIIYRCKHCDEIKEGEPQIIKEQTVSKMK